MSDTAGSRLLRDALQGSRPALDQVYGRYAPRLLSYIRLRLGRALRARLESRDILQATLLKSFEHLDDFHGRDSRSLMAWLARIADREIADRADYHGRRRREAGLADSLDDHADLPARVRSALSQVILDERAEQLEAAIESLSPSHREIVLLRKFEDVSFPEIARRLGRSEDACRMLFARAMTALTLKVVEQARA